MKIIIDMNLAFRWADMLSGASIPAVPNRAAAPSVIQIRAGDANPEELFETVYSTLIRLKREIEAGALVTIDIKKTRIHILPFA